MMFSRSPASAKPVAALLAVAWMTFAFDARAQQGGGDMPPPAVQVAEVITRPVSDMSTFSGSVEAIDEVDITARVQGFLDEVSFDAGASVKRGDVLFEIETATYDASVSAARAALAQAEAARDNAEQNLERQSALRDQSAIAAATLDQAQAEAKMAEADVASAEANLDQAMIELGYTTIEAPIDGDIGRALYSPGALVGPQSGSLARVVKLDPVRVVFSVSDTLLVSMRTDAAAGDLVDPEDLVFNIRLANGDDYSSKGRIDYVASETDSATGTVAVRLKFDNPDKVLVPGQLVDVTVGESDPPIMPTVPQTAVLQDREGRYVFVLNDDDTVALRRIEVGERVEGVWAVTDGLEAGEQVVVQGVQKIGDGAKVAPSSGSGNDQGRGDAEGDRDAASK